MQLSSILSGVQDLLGQIEDKADKGAQKTAGTSFADILETVSASAKAVSDKVAVVEPSAEEAKLRAKIADTGKAFEAQILSTMMQSMFNGVGGGEFSGGEGEKQFKSLLVDAFAKQTVKAGGLGIADQIAREMLKLQGLTDAPAPSAAA